jgi:hypothetical protein
MMLMAGIAPELKRRLGPTDAMLEHIKNKNRTKYEIRLDGVTVPV